MFENSRYSKILTGLLITGIIIIVGTLLILGIRLIRNYYIYKDAEDAVERFQGEINNNNK